MCLLHGCSLFISHYIAVLFTRGHYVAVLSLSASLDYIPLHDWFITYLLSLCLITLEFSLCVSHSIVRVSLYASLYCSSLHMYFITLYFSPYVPYDIAFLAIYTSSHCGYVNVCLITAFSQCMCIITCCFLHTLLFILLISSYVP